MCHGQLSGISCKTPAYKSFIFIAANSLRLIVCLYVSDWYLLGVKFHLSQPDWYFLGVHLNFPYEHSGPFCMGDPPPRAFTYNWWQLESDIWVRSFTTDDFISFRTYVDTPPPFLCRRSSWCKPKPSISISLFITVQFSHDCEIVSYAKPCCLLYLLLHVNKTLLL